VFTSQADTTSREAAVRAYARLLRVHAATVRCLGAGLLDRHGLSINDYEALHALAETETGFMKRVDLARSLALTPSGITRLLEGLEASGLVERARARATSASRTPVSPAPARPLAAACRDHEQAIAAVFEDALSDEEIDVFAELLAKLPGVELANPTARRVGVYGLGMLPAGVETAARAS
jgi:DNA-binding MarR family transcriptional regulator